MRLTGKEPKRGKQWRKNFQEMELDAVMVGGSPGELLWEFTPLD